MERVEAGRRTGTPTRVMADYPITDDEAADALVNWRVPIAQSCASLSGDVLCLASPEMAEDEWMARHVTAQ